MSKKLQEIEWTTNSGTPTFHYNIGKYCDPYDLIDLTKLRNLMCSEAIAIRT